MSDPQITFAIPFLANLGYLMQAVASVCNQTVQSWELLVVDDASDESPRRWIDALGDQRIRYVRNHDRLGLAQNWNRCLQLARAPLVTLLHADDRFHPLYAQRVLAAAAEWPTTAAIATDADVIGENGRPTRTLADWVKARAPRPDFDYEITGDDGLAAILRNNYLYSPTLCYRVALVGVSPFNQRWSMVTDLDLIARLLLDDQSIGVVNAPLYEYRRHRGSTSAQLTRDTSRFNEELALYQLLAAQASEQGWHLSATTARHRWMIRCHLAVRCVQQVGTGRPRQARRLATMLVTDVRRSASAPQMVGSASASTRAPKT